MTYNKKYHVEITPDVDYVEWENMHNWMWAYNIMTTRPVVFQNEILIINWNEYRMRFKIESYKVHEILPEQ